MGATRADLADALSARLPRRTRRGSTLPEVVPAVHGTAGSLAGALLLALHAGPRSAPAPDAAARRGGADTARTLETAEGDPRT
ncbi:ROK family protein [Streptomyces californicus]